MNRPRKPSSQGYGSHIHLLVSVLLAAALLLMLLPPGGKGETLYVDDDAGSGGDGSSDRPFSTIQEAVDEARDGDTIRVYEGEYYENVMIDRPLEVIGNASLNTTIQVGDGTGVTVDVDEVSLLHLAIENGEVGVVVLPGTVTATLENLSLAGNDIGIHLNSSTNVTITGSTISRNAVGILAENGATNTLVRRSVIAGNTEHGIDASSNEELELDASRCFWGHRTGPHHEQNNTAGAGDNVTDLVIIRPWYEEEEMRTLRVLNEDDDDSGVSSGLILLAVLLVVVLVLIVFVVLLPKRRFDAAWGWVVKTFELEDMSERDRFIIHFALYFLGLIVLVFLADLAAVSIYENSNSLEPLQRLETKLVAGFQNETMGIDVRYNGTVLFYDEDQEFWGHTLSEREKIGGVSFEVSATCSGFHETVFLSVLILGFYGVPMKKKLKWAGIFAVVIFVENLFRMIILFPYYLIYGRDEGELLHYNWWHHYQYIFIMALFMLWFYFVAWKDIDKELDRLDEAEKKAVGTEGSEDKLSQRLNALDESGKTGDGAGKEDKEDEVRDVEAVVEEVPVVVVALPEEEEEKTGME